MNNHEEIKDEVANFINSGGSSSASATSEISKSEKQIIDFLIVDICSNQEKKSDIRVYLRFLLEAIQEGSKDTKLFRMLSNFIKQNYTDTAICVYLQKYTFENNNYYFKNTREIFATSSRANNMDESSSSNSGPNFNARISLEPSSSSSSSFSPFSSLLKSNRVSPAIAPITGILENEYDRPCKKKPNAAYCQNPQTFAFPSCFLWDISGNNFVQENNNFNLNMIIFEIMIKIYDYAHDNTKSLDRVKGVDDAYINF